jgi:hypothetical protein
VTRSLPRALLVIACALLCTALLAACGGSGDGAGAPSATSPRAALEKTFGARSTSIDRARVVADLRLDPEGLLKLGGPIALRVTGPFAAPSASSGARFDLDLLATLGGQKFAGGAIATGTRSYLRLDDRVYALGGGQRKRPAATAAAAKPHPILTALGIDPLRWITGVRDAGSERVAGVATKHLTGDLDPRKLLADVGTLLDQAGGGKASIVSPELLTQIGAAAKSAKVDIWTGADDSILRRLAVDLRFAFKQAQSPIVGLDGGRITLGLRLDDVNGAPVTVTAPAGARPLSEVTGKGGIGALLGGLSAGLSGGIGGGAVELVGCVTGAAGSSVELVRCVSKLAP